VDFIYTRLNEIFAQEDKKKSEKKREKKKEKKYEIKVIMNIANHMIIVSCLPLLSEL